MPWIILIISAIFEAVWATALSLSDGFSQPVPTVIFVVALAISMLGLGQAMKSIPISTAYAVWVGLGAALTVSYAMLTGAEPFSLTKALFVAGIVACVIGLKLAKAPKDAAPASGDASGAHGRGVAT